MTMERGEGVLIVVPTYNEREYIDSLLDKVFKVLPEANVLFVDDNSQDGTQEMIEAYSARKLGQVHLMKRPRKMGLGTAYIQGFKWGLERSFQVISEMDADHSHNPNYLKDFIPLLKSHDVVVGSRYVPGGGTVNWGLIRKMISRFGSLYSRVILGLSIRDLTGGFNIWTRKVLESISLDEVRSTGYAFQIELKYRATLLGFNIVEFPIVFEDRRAGQSKMSGAIVVEAMIRVWALRRIKRNDGLVVKKSP